MDDERFDKLTEKQRECLRLAAQGLQEKEIAIRLDKNPAAIKERLRLARRHIGAATSREAGKLFIAWEQSRSSPPHVGFDPDSYTRGVERPEMLAESRFLRPSAGQANLHGRGATEELQETRATYRIDLRSRRRSIWEALFPPVGRRPNDLGRASRIAVIATQVAVLALCSAALIAAVIGASRYLVWLNTHGG
jgi:hypothetical protein